MVLGTLVFGSGAGRAALLRLRAQCQSRAAVVTLGDVAEISAADAGQARALEAIELFPAPPASQQRFVRLREIQDLLLLRGVNLAEHQFSGSSQVAILGRGTPAKGKPGWPLSPSVMKAANRRVTESVARYLQEYVSADPPWIVEAELGQRLARLVADPGRAISISGGAPPWTGPQRFEATVDTPGGPVRFSLDAQVEISPAVVVAARSLPRGTVIRAADVVLQRGVSEHSEHRRSERFTSIDEVVGKETARAIPEGKVLQQDAVRSPLLVRRGDVVTVYARNPGICVRTLGRARDNGSLGELVAVESLQDRSTYFARVSSVREVEVYARSPKADRATISGSQPALGRHRAATARSTYPSTTSHF
ncbi:MAG: flagellar basal body P-ring formation chaperone FlgA [Planctomycetota bacterium]|jgi:flagella basal body P-ring formation protein FlgA